MLADDPLLGHWRDHNKQTKYKNTKQKQKQKRQSVEIPFCGKSWRDTLFFFLPAAISENYVNHKEYRHTFLTRHDLAGSFLPSRQYAFVGHTHFYCADVFLRRAGRDMIGGGGEGVSRLLGLVDVSLDYS
jgi:hypothetical protein